MTNIMSFSNSFFLLCFESDWVAILRFGQVLLVGHML